MSSSGPAPRPLGPLAAVATVAEREVRERTRTRSFRWGTAVMAVLVALLAVLPRLLPDADDPSWTVAVVGEVPPGLEEAVAALAEVESAEVTLEPTGGSAEEAAGRDGVDAVLLDGRELVAEGPVPERLQVLLTSAVAQARLGADLAALGLDPGATADLLAVEPLAVRSVDDAEDRGARELVALMGSIVLLVAILTYGGWVLYSVLEEKANRIVEIVVSAIPPSQLLAGKVVGVGALAVVQLLLLLGVGVAASAAAGTLPDLPGFVPAAVAWSLLWFVLGFAFYAVGYAAAGALTARQEEAQSAASPLLTLVMVAYFASIFFVTPDPGGTVARVLSMVPFTAPIAMPGRIAAGDVATWEVVLAVAIMVVATWLVTRLAAAVYRNALLHGGGRLRAVEALRRARA